MDNSKSRLISPALGARKVTALADCYQVTGVRYGIRYAIAVYFGSLAAKALFRPSFLVSSASHSHCYFPDSVTTFHRGIAVRQRRRRFDRRTASLHPPTTHLFPPM